MRRRGSVVEAARGFADSHHFGLSPSHPAFSITGDPEHLLAGRFELRFYMLRFVNSGREGEAEPMILAARRCLSSGQK